MTIPIHGPATAKMARIRQRYDDAELAQRLREETRRSEVWQEVRAFGRLGIVGWIGKHSGEFLLNVEAS